MTDQTQSEDKQVKLENKYVFDRPNTQSEDKQVILEKKYTERR